MRKGRSGGRGPKDRLRFPIHFPLLPLSSASIPLSHFLSFFANSPLLPFSHLLPFTSLYHFPHFYLSSPFIFYASSFLYSLFSLFCNYPNFSNQHFLFFYFLSQYVSFFFFPLRLSSKNLLSGSLLFPFSD